jgi:hypothetical protein
LQVGHAPRSPPSVGARVCHLVLLLNPLPLTRAQSVCLQQRPATNTESSAAVRFVPVDLRLGTCQAGTTPLSVLVASMLMNVPGSRRSRPHARSPRRCCFLTHQHHLRAPLPPAATPRSATGAFVQTTRRPSTGVASRSMLAQHGVLRSPCALMMITRT